MRQSLGIELSWDAHIEAESFVVRRRKWKVKKMSFLEVSFQFTFFALQRPKIRTIVRDS